MFKKLTLLYVKAMISYNETKHTNLIYARFNLLRKPFTIYTYLVLYVLLPVLIFVSLIIFLH